jgi:hypothetical protein
MLIRMKELKGSKSVEYHTISGIPHTTVSVTTKGLFNLSDVELCEVDETPTTIDELKDKYSISNCDIVKIINDKLK